MLMPHSFPFTAVVGQEPMRRALMLNAIYPAIGGVLISGEKGTAKSTAARALTGLLPEITVVADCPYSCHPERAEESCTTCQERRERGETLPVATRRVRMVELPVGATEDRLLGTLDLESALQDGTCRFEPGMLAAANRGILYVDEVNLLPDHLVDALLDVAASGVNIVEREGVSFAHPARFILVGTMNPEEGELRPQFLDRFGITAEVLTLQDPELRYEVVRRRLAFERDPIGFCRAWEVHEQEEAHRVRQAAARLPEVRLDEALARSIAELCASAGVDGLRGDLVIHKAATALAAYAGRTQVIAEDVQQAVAFALSHRRRRRPFEPPSRQPSLSSPPPPSSLPPNLSQGEKKEDSPLNAPPSPSMGEGRGEGELPQERGQTRPDGGPEWHFTPQGDGTLPPLAPKSRSQLSHTGTRQAGVSPGSRGPRIGARPAHMQRGGTLALDATLRAAARFQPRRRLLPPHPGPLPEGEGIGKDGLLPPRGGLSVGMKAAGGPLSPRERVGVRERRIILRRQDLMVKFRRPPAQHLYILLVDSSGSMASYRRMAQVKGVLLGVLREVYRHRDGVAVIAFRGAQSELLLSPTRSPEAAQAFLEALPTGGRTPLAHALLRVEALLAHERQRKSGWVPVLVLVTDGRANRGLTRSDPLQESLSICVRMAGSGLHTVVVDTETGVIRLGLARQLAQALSGSYVQLEQLMRGVP